VNSATLRVGTQHLRSVQGVHRTEIERNFDVIVVFSEIERFLDATHR